MSDRAPVLRRLKSGRLLVWGGFAALLAVLPIVFPQGFAITLMSQMGIWIVFALSYNMLFGHTGMLSFGHAVYSGLGAYFTIHALKMIGQGALPLPVTLLPLVGGLAGLAFGVVFGWITTRKSGIAFAMISLGIGEMVFAASLMLPSFFGGEGGMSANRVVGGAVFGISYGPAIQVYYLIALWTFIAMAAMFALTQTPLGRIANAVRDNPERAEFIGYDTHTVRFLMLALSAFFAGVSGGLAAINYELVAAESVGTLRSGGVLLATFIGGAGFFFGPVIGAVLYTFFVVALSNVTQAWLLYLGVFFMILVMYAPGGIASLVFVNLRAAKAGLLRRLLVPYAGLLASAALALLGFVAAVEMTYALSGDAGKELWLFGAALDARAPAPWLASLALFAAGGLALAFAWRRVRREWDDIQQHLSGA
jgi:branched-chain amino acid transport system permease protein